MTDVDREAVKAALAALNKGGITIESNRLALATALAGARAYADQQPASAEEIDRIIAGAWYEGVHGDALCRRVARAMERHHGIAAPEPAKAKELWSPPDDDRDRRFYPGETT